MASFAKMNGISLIPVSVDGQVAATLPQSRPDKAMLEAHNHAVRVAAGYVEKLISARVTKDGVTSIAHTGKMVAAAFTHDTSRNLDPLIHTHLLIANMTEHEGKWKALATDYIHNAGFIETVMKHQVTLGKIYRGALRQRVETLGHEVEEVGKHGMWEIKAIPEEVREEYSSRGREIRGAVGAEATLRSRDVAAKDAGNRRTDPHTHYSERTLIRTYKKAQHETESLSYIYSYNIHWL